MQLDDSAYFAIAQNVDAYGGALAKRAGSQLVNGWGTVLTATAEPGATVLSVRDGTHFVDGQAVWIGPFSHTVTFHSFDAVGITPALTAFENYDEGTPVVQGFPATGDIQTLFQAVFRNTDKTLWAAVGGAPVRVLAGQAPVAITYQLPSTTVASGGAVASAVFSSTLGLRVKDWITITGTTYSVQVQSINQTTGTVTWAPALASAPANGTVIVFTSRRLKNPTPPMEFVQYGNYTYVVGGFQDDGTGLHGWPTTPLAIRQTNPLLPGSTLYANRMGIKPPLKPPLVGGNYNSGMTSGLITGNTYGYRVRYVNSVTGQESEAGPEVRVEIGTAPNNSALITAWGSPDPQVDQIRLYRTSGNGGGAWYRVLQWKEPGGPVQSVEAGNTIPDPGHGASIEIADWSSDEELGKVPMRDLMDTCIPDTVSLLAVWGQANRLIAIDRVTNSVVFSDQPDLETGRLKGESWPSNNQIFVAYDDGDALTGLASFFDSVLVFKEHSVWRITGIPPDIRIEPLHYRQDQTATGCKSQRLIMVDHDEVIYRGTDAIYELNRFQGQSEGFKSQRLSVPIDEAVQTGYDDFVEEPVGHGVYYRYKRQVRLWETTRRALVLQFESTAEGEPFGWGEWITTVPDMDPFALGLSGPRCSCIARYDPAVFRGTVSAMLPGTTLDAANFVAIDGGYVVQLDIGQADYGCSPYEVIVAPIQFSPAGRGIPARGRALDWQVQQINNARPTNTFFTDWMQELVTTDMTLLDGFQQMDPNQIDLIGVPLPTFDTLSTLVIAPGHHHQFMWREIGLASYYRIQGWTYWFQPLATQAVWRQFKQASSAVISALPNP